MRDQSRLVVSLDCEKTDIDKKIKIANASARLIEDEAVKYLFQEMEENLYRAFSNVQTPDQGEALWREIKVIKALRENMEWYANQRETLAKKARRR